MVLETNRTSLCHVGLLPPSVGTGFPRVPVVLFLPHLCRVQEPDAREMLFSLTSLSKPGEVSVGGDRRPVLVLGGGVPFYRQTPPGTLEGTIVGAGVLAQALP